MAEIVLNVKSGKRGTKLAFLKLLSWIIGQNENSSLLLQIGKKGKNVGGFTVGAETRI